MKTKTQLIWELLGHLCTLAAYCLIAYAAYRKEWGEATMWLVWLILDRMPRRSA